MIKHATADTFILHEGRVALVHHPIFGAWVTPGGHVEATQNPAEAALAEVDEETGLSVILLARPGLYLPTIEEANEVAVPWFIREQVIPGDNHVRGPHVHVDLQYVATCEDPEGEGSHEWRWFGAEELGDVETLGDCGPTARFLINRLVVRL